MDADQVTVEIRSRLWIDSVGEAFPDQDLIVIQSRGFAVMVSKRAEEIYPERNETNNKAKALSFVYKTFEEKPKQLPLWVILVAAAGGVLLLALIILILWKLNFFKRQKLESAPQYKAVKSKETAADPEEAELETLNWNYSG